MTKLLKQVSLFMQNQNKAGLNIQNTTNTELVNLYYDSIGCGVDISTNDWLVGLADGTYPTVNELRMAIRNVRQLYPQWIRIK